jgi:hypothetical protein
MAAARITGCLHGQAGTTVGLPQIAADLRTRQGRQPWALCHEVTPVHAALRNCTRDEGWPVEIGNQVLISSHRKLLGSKVLVVNVAEKTGHDPVRYG